MNSTIPSTMHAVQLTGHGGLDKLDYRRDVPVPKPSADEVLIKVGACGMNNTDMIGPFGYAADVSRTFFSGPGKPSTYQKELYQRAHEEVHQNLGLMQPGMSFKEITEKAYRQPDKFVASRYPVLAHGCWYVR